MTTTTAVTAEPKTYGRLVVLKHVGYHGTKQLVIS